MTKTIKPFDASGWFPIHNAVFDVIMPTLSGSAWKVLCVAIRQTWGWVADPDGDPRVRKEWDRISYSQFQHMMGCARATVSKALNECLTAGYLLRRQMGQEHGKPLYVYSLNRDFELVMTSSEIEPVTSSEIEPVTGSEIELTKQRETKETKDDGVPPEHNFTLLCDFGISKPVARDLARQCDAEQIAGWLAYAKSAHGLSDPVAFVVRRLKDGEPVPDSARCRVDSHATDRARYAAWNGDEE